MNKKISINALCILIIIFLVASIVMPGIAILGSFAAGVANGFNAEPAGSISELTPVEVSFDPSIEELSQPTHSMTFGQGEDLQIIYHQGIVMVPTERVHDSFVLEIILYIVMMAVLILLIIDFIKFIMNINRGLIFERKNVKHLGRFGLYLIIIGVLECIDGFIRQMDFSSINLTLNGYELSSEWAIPWATFLLGLLAILMARIWAVGISMKEEQEFTI